VYASLFNKPNFCNLIYEVREVTEKVENIKVGISQSLGCLTHRIL